MMSSYKNTLLFFQLVWSFFVEKANLGKLSIVIHHKTFVSTTKIEAYQICRNHWWKLITFFVKRLSFSQDVYYCSFPETERNIWACRWSSFVKGNLVQYRHFCLYFMNCWYKKIFRHRLAFNDSNCLNLNQNYYQSQLIASLWILSWWAQWKETLHWSTSFQEHLDLEPLQSRRILILF